MKNSMSRRMPVMLSDLVLLFFTVFTAFLTYRAITEGLNILQPSQSSTALAQELSQS